MDELIRRVPSSIEAEQSVIGSMILDSRCVPDVVEILHAEDFYLEQNREIFETIYSMFSFAKAIDPVTLLDEMKVRGVYDERTSRSYILQLLDITPTSVNAKRYAEIVRDKSMLRQIQTAADEIANIVTEGEGEAEEILDAAEQKIYAVRQGRTNQGFAQLSAVILDVYAHLNELAARRGELPGLSTGITELDNITAGLNKSDLIMFASRPGMGKTSIALNIALNAAKKAQKAVAFFSLEMSREQIGARLISGEGFVDSRKLLVGDLEDDDWEKIAHASETLSKCDIKIDDNPSVTPAEMKAKCRRIDNLGLVIIDYLQLMTTGGRRNDNRVQEVSEISRSLKIMAKELNVPVVCLSQLSRANERRTDKRPMMSDLRESGAIEQDADIIIFLYRDEYYNEDSDRRNIAECIVAKNRHGSTGTIELQWIPQYTTFVSRDRFHD